MKRVIFRVILICKTMLYDDNLIQKQEKASTPGKL